jgi:hypothetical protein
MEAMHHLVCVDGPVGEELRQHGPKEPEQSSGSADRDVVPDEQRRKHAASDARDKVDDANSHCNGTGTQNQIRCSPPTT